MKYIAIFGYDAKTDKALACVLGDKPSMNPLGYYNKSVAEIINLVISQRMKPLNFGIDRYKKLVQDFGVFSRFSKEGTLIIVAEFVNKSGEVLGYRVLSSTNGAPFNMTLNDLKQFYIKRKEKLGSDYVFIQNAVVRQQANDITIACYPLKTYEQIKIGNVKQINTNEHSNKVAEAEVKPTAKVKVNPIQTIKEEQNFTEDQDREIALCKEAGVDPKLINNPNLTKEQMRVIWFSKAKKGALAEYFAKPEFPLESMKFYADILCSETLAKAYKPLLAHPELDVYQLQELVNCINSGVEVKDLIGKSADEVYCARMENDPTFWSMATFDSNIPSEEWNRTELFDLMMKETTRLHTNAFQTVKPQTLKYFEIHMSYGTHDSDGYTVCVEAGDENEAVQIMTDEHLYQEPEDLSNIDYVSEITEEEFEASHGFRKNK